jgi:hypothetical protein
MVNQKAIDAIESRFQIHVPESVRLFYKFPGYALFIQAHFDADVFMEPHFSEEDPERPIITKSAYPPWLAIGQSPHTGMLLMVQLDTPVPQVAWRDLDPASVDYIFPGTFQDWLLTGTDGILSHSADFCAECKKANDRSDA